MPNMIVPKTLKELFNEYMKKQHPNLSEYPEYPDSHVFAAVRDAFYAGAFHMAADFNPNHLAELKQYAASKSIVEGIKQE